MTRPTGRTTFGYTAIGNLATNGENGGAIYAYPTLGSQPHAVVTANGKSYAYDANGNMTVRGPQRLAYDPENRLVGVTNGSSKTSFGYDARGRRLWKQSPGAPLNVWIGDNYEEKQSKVLFHVLAAGRLVCTFDKAGTLFEYCHPDHLHSTAVLTDSTGAQVQHYEYAGFGQDRCIGSSTAFPLSRRYTSQYLDEETGLYYYGARYYDPVVGRFVQPDVLIPELFDPQSYNRYSYALSNPLRYADSSGHGPDEVLTAASARALLLNEDAGAQTTVQWGTSAAHTTAAAGRALAELNPVVGVFNSGYQLGTGNDAIDYHPLSTRELVWSGIQLGLTVAPPVLKGGRIVGAAMSSEVEVAGLTWSAWSFRGQRIEMALGKTLPDGFPVIDRFIKGVATSIKSVDLTAKTYQDTGTLSRLINGYVDKVAAFQGAEYGTTVIKGSEITARQLQLAVRAGRATIAQSGAIAAAAGRARRLGLGAMVPPIK